MPTKPLDTPIKRQARLLMEEARRTDPSIIRFYWFPDDSEVRLVEVATDMQPSLSNDIEPFYFPAAPSHDLPAPSGVALIRDGEDWHLNPPPGWGNWKDAEELKPEGAL